jgi:CRP-like cAMP-binding protein
MKTSALSRQDQLMCACPEPLTAQLRLRHSESRSCAALAPALVRSAFASPEPALAYFADSRSDRPNVKEILRKPCTQFPHVKYAAGQILFRQGDPADAVFYIESGRLHRLITTERGDERLISILGSRDFCGEESLTQTLYRATSAVVVEDAEIIRIDKGLMPELLRDSPDFASTFTTFLLSHCLATEATLVDYLFEPVEQRLRRVLWKLADFGESEGRAGIVSNVKQQMLADMVGTTRPRVNYLLNKLRKLGLIDYGGTLRRGDILVHRRLRPPEDIHASGAN